MVRSGRRCTTARRVSLLWRRVRGHGSGCGAFGLHYSDCCLSLLTAEFFLWAAAFSARAQCNPGPERRRRAVSCTRTAPESSGWTAPQSFGGCWRLVGHRRVSSHGCTVNSAPPDSESRQHDERLGKPHAVLLGQAGRYCPQARAQVGPSDGRQQTRLSLAAGPPRPVGQARTGAATVGGLAWRSESPWYGSERPESMQ